MPSGADHDKLDRETEAGMGQVFSQRNRMGEGGELLVHVRVSPVAVWSCKGSRGAAARKPGCRPAVPGVMLHPAEKSGKSPNKIIFNVRRKPQLAQTPIKQGACTKR
ncbi:hypothetical protein GCM10011324_14760 [Allosediminivita pacifica]|nr:hypothetical protein GCM10011324_14760 [Allosediminivita pacifica]